MIYRKSKLITIILIILLSTVSLGLIVAGSIAKSKEKESAAVDKITEIGSLSDLEQFRDSVNEGDSYTGVTVRLNSDIEITTIFPHLDSHKLYNLFVNNCRLW